MAKKKKKVVPKNAAQAMKRKATVKTATAKKAPAKKSDTINDVVGMLDIIEARLDRLRNNDTTYRAQTKEVLDGLRDSLTAANADIVTLTRRVRDLEAPGSQDDTDEPPTLSDGTVVVEADDAHA